MTGIRLELPDPGGAQPTRYQKSDQARNEPREFTKETDAWSNLAAGCRCFRGFPADRC